METRFGRAGAGEEEKKGREGVREGGGQRHRDTEMLRNLLPEL